jgi:hypothetical protein
MADHESRDETKLRRTAMVTARVDSRQKLARIEVGECDAHRGHAVTVPLIESPEHSTASVRELSCPTRTLALGTLTVTRGQGGMLWTFHERQCVFFASQF